MADLRAFALAFNRHDIEPARPVFDTVLEEISFGRPAEGLLLPRRDGVFRRPIGAIPPQLHFDEHELTGIVRDEVDLPPAVAVIALQNAEAVLFKKGRRDPFSRAPPFLPAAGVHAMNVRKSPLPRKASGTTAGGSRTVRTGGSPPDARVSRTLCGG